MVDPISMFVKALQFNWSVSPKLFVCEYILLPRVSSNSGLPFNTIQSLVVSILIAFDIMSQPAMQASLIPAHKNIEFRKFEQLVPKATLNKCFSYGLVKLSAKNGVIQYYGC